VIAHRREEDFGDPTEASRARRLLTPGDCRLGRRKASAHGVGVVPSLRSRDGIADLILPACGAEVIESVSATDHFPERSDSGRKEATNLW
jgi:hypothetical protein